MNTNVKVATSYAYITKSEFDSLVETVTRGTQKQGTYKCNPPVVIGNGSEQLTFHKLSYVTKFGEPYLYSHHQEFSIRCHTESFLRAEEERERRKEEWENGTYKRNKKQKDVYEEFDENAVTASLWHYTSLNEVSIEREEENPLNEEKLALLLSNSEPATKENAPALYEKRKMLSLNGWYNPFRVLIRDVYAKGMYLKKGTSLQFSYDVDGKLIGCQARKNDQDLTYTDKNGEQHTTSKNYIVFTKKDCGWFSYTPEELSKKHITTLVIAEGAFTAEALKRGLYLNEETTLCYALHGCHFNGPHAKYLLQFMEKFGKDIDTVLYYREYANEDKQKEALINTAKEIGSFCKTYLPKSNMYSVNLNDELAGFINPEKGLDADDIWNYGYHDWFSKYIEYHKLNNDGHTENVVNLASSCGSGKSTIVFPHLAHLVVSDNGQIVYVSKTKKTCAEVCYSCLRNGLSADNIALVQDADEEELKQELYQNLSLYGCTPVKRCNANYSKRVIFITEASLYLHITNRDNCLNGGDELIRQFQRTNAIVVWDEKPNSWVATKAMPVVAKKDGTDVYGTFNIPIYNWFKIIYMDGTGDLTYNCFETKYTFKDCLNYLGYEDYADRLKKDVDTTRTNSHYHLDVYKLCGPQNGELTLNDCLKTSFASGKFTTEKPLVLVVRKSHLLSLQKQFPNAQFQCISDVNSTTVSTEKLDGYYERLKEQLDKGVGKDTVLETLSRIKNAKAKYQFTAINVNLEDDVYKEVKEYEQKGNLIVTSLGYNSGTNLYREYTQMISVGDVHSNYFQSVSNADVIAQHIQDFTRIARNQQEAQIDVYTDSASQLMFALEVPKFTFIKNTIYKNNIQFLQTHINNMVEELTIDTDKRKTFKCDVRYHGIIKDKEVLRTKDVLDYLKYVVASVKVDRFCDKFGSIIEDARLLYGLIKQAEKGKIKYLSSLLRFMLNFDIQTDWKNISDNIEEVMSHFDSNNGREPKRVSEILKKTVNPIISRGEYTEYKATLSVERIKTAPVKKQKVEKVELPFKDFGNEYQATYQQKVEMPIQVTKTTPTALIVQIESKPIEDGWTREQYDEYNSKYWKSLDFDKIKIPF